MRAKLIALTAGLTVLLGLGAAQPARAHVPQISPQDGACGVFFLNNGTGGNVTPNGLDQVLTLGSGGHFCLASTGDGVTFKIHVQSDQSHCVTRTTSVLIINGCVQGQSAQKFQFGAPDDRGDWAGVGGCCITYTNFDTNGSQLRYAANGGPWDNWHFTRTNARTQAHTTAYAKPSHAVPVTTWDRHLRKRTTAVFLIEYNWQRTYQISGAGLDQVAKLVHGIGETYSAFAVGNEWYFVESTDHSRCLVHSAIFVKTGNCSSWPKGKMWLPESSGSYFRFRQPGATFVISINLPAKNNTQVYVAPGGSKGRGQAWYLNVLN